MYVTDRQFDLASGVITLTYLEAGDARSNPDKSDDKEGGEHGSKPDKSDEKEADEHESKPDKSEEKEADEAGPKPDKSDDKEADEVGSKPDSDDKEADEAGPKPHSDDNRMVTERGIDQIDQIRQERRNNNQLNLNSRLLNSFFSSQLKK